MPATGAIRPARFSSPSTVPRPLCGRAEAAPSEEGRKPRRNRSTWPGNARRSKPTGRTDTFGLSRAASAGRIWVRSTYGRNSIECSGSPAHGAGRCRCRARHCLHSFEPADAAVLRDGPARFTFATFRGARRASCPAGRPRFRKKTRDACGAACRFAGPFARMETN